MIRDDEYETLEDCKILICTAKAVKVNYEGSLYWIPLSTIEDAREIEPFADIDLSVKRWFCVREEIL